MSIHFTKIYIVVFSILSLLAACKDTSTTATAKKDDTIFTTVYIRYLEAEKQLKAEAQFKIGDSLHLATSMSLDNNLFFQGGAMEERNINNNILYRSLRGKVEYEEIYRFQFQDVKKVPYSLDISMGAVSDVDFKTPVYKNKDWQLKLKKRLYKGESLVLVFNGENNNSGSLMISGPSKDNIITISSSQMQSLPSGKGNIYFVKKKQIAQKLDNYTINALIEFYSKEKPLEILD